MREYYAVVDDTCLKMEFIVRSLIRKSSISKRVSARISPDRYIRHSLGLKAPRGVGWFTNPKKAAYNRFYNRTSVDLTRSGLRGGVRGTCGAAGIVLSLIVLCVLAVPIGVVAVVVYLIANSPRK